MPRTLFPCGEDHPNVKLTRAQVDELRALHAAGGITHEKLAERFNITTRYVGDILRRRVWK